MACAKRVKERLALFVPSILKTATGDFKRFIILAVPSGISISFSLPLFAFLVVFCFFVRVWLPSFLALMMSVLFVLLFSCSEGFAEFLSFQGNLEDVLCSKQHFFQT